MITRAHNAKAKENVNLKCKRCITYVKSCFVFLLSANVYIHVGRSLFFPLLEFSIRLWSITAAFLPLSLLCGGNAVYVIPQQSF